MKRFLALMMAAIMVLGLTACGGKEEAASGDNGGASAAEPVVLRLSTHVNEVNASGWQVKKLAEHVKEVSGGAMEIDLYFDGQLGGQTENCEGMIAGTIDMSIMDSGTLANYDPRIGILDMPYTFENKEQCRTVLANGLEETLANWVTETCGIRPISLQCTMFRNSFVDGKVISDVNAFKGVKMRIPDNPSMKICFEALGATPVAMPSGEAYTAIQTGVADACEGPYDFVYEAKFYEVAGTCSLTEHVLCCTAICISEASWKKLTAEQQGWLSEAVEKTREEFYPMVEELEQTRRGELEAQNVEFHEVDKEGMIAACAPALEAFVAEHGLEDIYADILALA